MDFKVNFLNYNCNVTVHHYVNGEICLKLESAETDIDKDLFEGEPIATATVNHPDIKIQENQILVKNYSENRGMLKSLVDAGIVKNEENYIVYNVGSDPSENMVIANLTENFIAHIVQQENNIRNKKRKM